MSVLISDTFTGSNGTSLNGRTPDTTNTPGNNWAQQLSTWTISSNAAVSSAGGFLTNDHETGDVDITVPVTFLGGFTSGGIGVRYVDSNNWIRVALDEAANTVVVTVVVAGSGSTPAGGSASVSGGITTGPTYTLRVRLVSNVMDVWVDGNQLITSLSITNFSSSYLHGLFASANVSIGSYVAEDVPPPDTTPPTMSGATIGTNGTSFTATLSEACTPSSGTGGFTLAGTSAALTTWAISGTAFTATLSPAAYDGETITLSYDRANTTDDIVDGNTNYLANFTGASVTNNSTVPVPPDAPTGLTVVSIDGDEVTISWNEVDDADGYELQYDTAATFDVNPITVDSPGGTDPEERIQFADGTWYVRVRAYIGESYGTWSDDESFVVGGGGTSTATARLSIGIGIGL